MGATTEVAAAQERKGRMRAEEVGAIFGVWADLDVAGPAHSAQNLPPDLPAVRRIHAEMVIEPTLLWSSGNGYQAFWAFTAPLVFDTADERAEAAALVADWLRSLTAHAHRLGRWRVDAVQDLSRVLRLPGSTNRKPSVDGAARPAARVELLDHHPDLRYTPDQIRQHCLDAEFLDAHEAMVAPSRGDAMAVDLAGVWKLCNSAEYRARNYEPEWWADVLEILREDMTPGSAIETIVKVWEFSGTGRPFGDHSKADASMARNLAGLDLDERDAAEIITCMRLRSKHKIDKVQPTRRGQNYLVGLTIGKCFASARKATEDRKVAVERQDAELDAQDAVAAQRADMTLLAAREQRDPHGDDDDDSPVAVAGLAGRALRKLAETPRVVPDRIPQLEHGPADGPTVDEPDPAVDEPLDGDPAGDEPDPVTDDPLDEPVDDEPPPTQDPPHDPPPPIDDLPPAADTPDDDNDDEPIITVEPPSGDAPRGPGRSIWAPRTETTATTLKALSADLLDERNGEIEIYGLQQRHRGAEAKRRLVLRPGPRMAWPNQLPDGYKRGQVLVTGWWPAATFDKIGGWYKALEQDCLLLTKPMSAEDFRTRYGRALVRLWEPDDSGGSLTATVREALRTYLLDFHPSREWNEAAQVGTAWLMMQGRGWTPDHDFAVLVRWLDFGKYVRTNYAQQVGPAVLAEMAELVGALDAVTPEQDGRWRVLRRDTFHDRVWAVILENARIEAQRREDRHGMRVLRDRDRDGDGEEHLDDETGHLRDAR